MSPEYKSFINLPPAYKAGLKSIFEDELPSMINKEEIAFLVTKNGYIEEILIGADIIDQAGIRNRVKKSNSRWHLVHPLYDEGKRLDSIIKQFYQKTCTGHFRRGYGGAKYRGKHRSHTKGRGLEAALRAKKGCR